jgi:hypothetical protein
MSSAGAARAAALSPARAEASRRNGAKSCGPITAEGKARAAQNALKHGFRAQKHVVLPGEDAAAFQEIEAGLIEELAPEGALQAALAQRVVAAMWRLARADRIEAGLFEHHLRGDRNLGVALIRDGNGARAFDTLLRYRGGATAELWRALRALKALQAERAAAPPALAPRLLPEPQETPIEPESRGNPEHSEPSGDPSESTPVPAAIVPAATPCDRASARTALPDEPDSRGNSGDLGQAGPPCHRQCAWVRGATRPGWPRPRAGACACSPGAGDSA